ncbi:hypothetical protein ACH4E8_25145 [Streptomyces sp. NPDC017979]|uniref:hypothetical protein n=1 Tax=Streptomyces sp. NPDC017979 TaxID=3365024 RepID=UPI00378C363C
MRTVRTILRAAPAPVLATVLTGALSAGLLWATPPAASHERHEHDEAEAREAREVLEVRERQRTYRADCRTEVRGSRAFAYCHNPYPVVDRVRLHVECDRWWDVDADGEPADVGPAQYRELTERCWKEVRAVWVSHQPLVDG